MPLLLPFAAFSPLAGRPQDEQLGLSFLAVLEKLKRKSFHHQEPQRCHAFWAAVLCNKKPPKNMEPWGVLVPYRCFLMASASGPTYYNRKPPAGRKKVRPADLLIYYRDGSKKISQPESLWVCRNLAPVNTRKLCQTCRCLLRSLVVPKKVPKTTAFHPLGRTKHPM